jgi:hypothetical protein
MAIAINAVEYGFDTRLTNLATDTTLAASARHDFAAVTLHIPETTSRTFRSVFVEVTARDAFTAATSFSSIRCGIKLGAVAFTDTDIALPLANTADHEMLGPLMFDVTAYFNTNFGSGASQTCQVGIAIATSVAANVNNICAKLYITYEADNASATKVRTARIPIQSHHTFLGISDVEAGTTGGVSDAPVNQIPQLTGVGGFLPEAGVTIRQAFIETWCADLGAAATAFNLIIKIDSGGADNARATLEQTLVSNTSYHDLFIYDTGTFSPASAHAYIVRSSLATRFEFPGGYMTVTYTYDDSTTTTELRSLVLPCEAADSDDILNILSTATDESLQYQTVVDIEEPGPITLKQSGAFFDDSLISASVLRVFAPSQAERTYTHVNASLSGMHYLVRRTDHDSGWSLSRGRNVLPLKLWNSSSAAGSVSAFTLLNYHAGRCLNGNVSAPYIGSNIAATSALITTLTDMLRKPVIPETQYVISAVLARAFMRTANLSSTNIVLLAERNALESSGDGWWIKQKAGAGAVECGTRVGNSDTSAWWRLTHLDQVKGDIEAVRRWRLHSTVTMTPHFMLWVTHHARTFAVAGTITAANGTAIQVWNAGTKEFVGEGVVASNAFSINVMSDANPVFATSPTGRSANGTPGVSTFNISTGGGSDTASGGKFGRGFN